MRCCVGYCMSYWEVGVNNVGFHNLPKCKKYRDLWKTALKPFVLETVDPKRHRVCSLHFKEQDFKSLEGKRILEMDAVPSVFYEEEPNAVSTFVCGVEPSNQSTNMEERANMDCNSSSTNSATHTLDQTEQVASHPGHCQALPVYNINVRYATTNQEFHIPGASTRQSTETLLKAIDNKLECLTRNSQEDELDNFGKHLATQLRQLPLANALVCLNFINNFLVDERLKILNCNDIMNINASALNVNLNLLEPRRTENVVLRETSNNPTVDALELMEEETKFFIDLSDTIVNKSCSHVETTARGPNF